MITYLAVLALIPLSIMWIWLLAYIDKLITIKITDEITTKTKEINRRLKKIQETKKNE